MFYVGQKVVALRGRGEWGEGALKVSVPAKGSIYTIRDLSKREGVPCLFLKEIVNDPWLTTMGLVEVAFDCKHFRPLDERQTDITIFQEIVRKVQNNEPVEVA